MVGTGHDRRVAIGPLITRHGQLRVIRSPGTHHQARFLLPGRPACCISLGLLPVPWVVSAAGEGGALATEAEHGQGDEGLGAVESVCHAGDEPYLGID
jgi:hypothetical protein